MYMNAQEAALAALKKEKSQFDAIVARYGGDTKYAALMTMLETVKKFGFRMEIADKGDGFTELHLKKETSHNIKLTHKLMVIMMNPANPFLLSSMLFDEARKFDSKETAENMVLEGMSKEEKYMRRKNVEDGFEDYEAELSAMAEVVHETLADFRNHITNDDFNKDPNGVDMLERALGTVWPK